MAASNDETTRVRWNNEAIKCFLEACIAEVSKVGRKGSSLHIESWVTVGKVLMETCKFKVNQKQMKNHYDYLKGKYTGWVYLKGKTGNLYDPTTNTFNLTPEKWEDFFKGHPKAKTLRMSPLVFPDLCTALFEGAAATGDLQWAPSSNYPRPRDSSPSFPSQTMLELENEGLSHQSQQGGNPNPSTPGSQSGTSIPPNVREREDTFTGGRPRKRNKSSIKVTQLEEDMSSALKVIIKNHDGPTYDECVDKLNELGWDKSSHLYIAALGIFCEAASYRKGWMSLPLEENNLINGWVTSIGAKLGFHV